MECIPFNNKNNIWGFSDGRDVNHIYGKTESVKVGISVKGVLFVNPVKYVLGKKDYVF